MLQKKECMISNDRNVNTLYSLVQQCKRYFELRIEMLQLGGVEFFTILFSRILLFLVLLVPVFFVLVFLTIISTIMLADAFNGSWVAACAMMCAFYVMVGIVVYANRVEWIVNPLTDRLARAILAKESEKAKKLEEEEEV